jgi:hypothetical protein
VEQGLGVELQESWTNDCRRIHPHCYRSSKLQIQVFGGSCCSSIHCVSFPLFAIIIRFRLAIDRYFMLAPNQATKLKLSTLERMHTLGKSASGSGAQQEQQLIQQQNQVVNAKSAKEKKEETKKEKELESSALVPSTSSFGGQLSSNTGHESNSKVDKINFGDAASNHKRKRSITIEQSLMQAQAGARVPSLSHAGSSFSHVVVFFALCIGPTVTSTSSVSYTIGSVQPRHTRRGSNADR